MMHLQKKNNSKKTSKPGELNVNESMIQNNRQEENTVIINLLEERKRLLTDNEKEIIQNAFDCNRENENDIIIER